MPPEVRETKVARVMKGAAEQFSHEATATRYADLYEKMLARPLVDLLSTKAGHRTPDERS